MPWTDRDGNPLEAPEPPPEGTFYAEIGDFQGPAYRRNAFALGTRQEVDHLWTALRLEPGMVVADVGCGVGRHSELLVERGARPVGADLSFGLLQAARPRGRYVQADGRRLPLRAAAADAALCLSQGGFGVTPGGDRAILDELARVVRPGGRVALTAFSLAFAARWLGPEDAIDVERGLVWSPADVRAADGSRRRYDLWATAYSIPHLKTVIGAGGLELEEVSGIEPGQYGSAAPTIADPELLVVAVRP
jgi:ubiquinone/menaquinone biosynthesis C-methylase UbiE